MICEVIYGPKSFGQKDEFWPLIEAIEIADRMNRRVWFRGHNLPISEGGIQVILHQVNEPLPDFLVPLRPTRVHIFDVVNQGFRRYPFEPKKGLYVYGKSTAHVETVHMSDGTFQTQIGIESSSVKSAVALLRKIREGTIEPKEAWVV